MSCKSCGVPTGTFVKDGRTFHYRLCYKCKQTAPPAPECVVAGCTKPAKDRSVACWDHRREMAVYPCRKCGKKARRHVGNIFCQACNDFILNSSAGEKEFLAREEQKIRDEIQAQLDARRVRFAIDPADLFEG